jgi:hypothetical protein
MMGIEAGILRKKAEPIQFRIFPVMHPVALLRGGMNFSFIRKTNSQVGNFGL